MYTQEEDSYYDLLDYDTKLNLTKYILFILESEVYLDQLKYSNWMCDEKNFSPYEEFIKFRSDYFNNVINVDSICTFFKNSDFSLGKLDVNLLLRRFSNIGEAISYKEFVKGIIPYEI